MACMLMSQMVCLYRIDIRATAWCAAVTDRLIIPVEAHLNGDQP